MESKKDNNHIFLSTYTQWPQVPKRNNWAGYFECFVSIYRRSNHLTVKVIRSELKNIHFVNVRCTALTSASVPQLCWFPVFTTTLYIALSCVSLSWDPGVKAEKGREGSVSGFTGLSYCLRVLPFTFFSDFCQKQYAVLQIPLISRTTDLNWTHRHRFQHASKTHVFRSMCWYCVSVLCR